MLAVTSIPSTDSTRSSQWYRTLLGPVDELAPAAGVTEFELRPGTWLQVLGIEGGRAARVCLAHRRRRPRDRATGPAGQGHGDRAYRRIPTGGWKRAGPPRLSRRPRRQQAVPLSDQRQLRSETGSGVEIRAVGRRARVNLGAGGDAAGKREQHQDGGKHPTKARQGGGHHRNPRQRMRRRAPRAEPAPAGALVRPTRRRGAAPPAHKAWVSMRAIRHRPLKRARHTPGFRFASARRSFRPGFRMPLANS